MLIDEEVDDVANTLLELELDVVGFKSLEELLVVVVAGSLLEELLLVVRTGVLLDVDDTTLVEDGVEVAILDTIVDDELVPMQNPNIGSQLPVPQ